MRPATLIAATERCYARIARWLCGWVGPLTLLLMRLWVADAFWRAGIVKFADPEGTRVLFEHLYHVPVLASGAAAVLGTWIELLAPWLLGLGIAGRLTALFLFVYNLVAVISYPDLWPHGFWIDLLNPGAFADHKAWAMLLLAITAWGPGPWSLDGIVKRVRRA